MDLQSLRIFKTVAEEGSVSAAARRLHYVQSNVTARLRQLEDSLGTPLFHRVNRRLQITPAGRTLLGYAGQLLGLAQAAQQAVRVDQAPHGPLLIGAMETAAAARLPQALAGFHRRHPQVELQLDTGPSDQLVAEVLAYRLDCALVSAPQEQAQLCSERVFTETLVLITAADVATVRTPHDLPRAHLLAFRPGCGYRRRLEQWVAQAGIAPLRISGFGSFEAIIGCVAAGMGVSLLPASVVEPARRLGTIAVHPLPAALAQVDTLLIWREDAGRHAAREAFLACLREQGAAHESPACLPASPAVVESSTAG